MKKIGLIKRFASYSDFPSEGMEKFGYLAKDTGYLYHWNGSSYVGIGSSASQDSDGDLTAIAALTGTGLAKRTGEDTWELDNNVYLTADDREYEINEYTPDADGVLLTLPAGYKLSDLTFVNTGTSSIDVNIGTTSGDTDVLNAETVGTDTTVHSSIQSLFDVDAEQDIYISATSWTDVILTVHAKYERIA